MQTARKLSVVTAEHAELETLRARVRALEYAIRSARDIAVALSEAAPEEEAFAQHALVTVLVVLDAVR